MRSNAMIAQTSLAKKFQRKLHAPYAEEEARKYKVDDETRRPKQEKVFVRDGAQIRFKLIWILF